MLHTAIYDAWAAYDSVPDGVHYTGKATTTAATLAADRERVISFAAYETLAWLFPGRAGDYKLQMDELDYTLTDASGPAQVGRAAFEATKLYRGSDNSNQQTTVTNAAASPWG